MTESVAPAPSKPQLECVRFGEIIQVPMKDGNLEKLMVMNFCGHEATAPSYYCDGHDAKLANVGRLMEHLEEVRGDSNPCRLVIWCRKHQWFERISMAQQEGFKKAGFLG